MIVLGALFALATSSGSGDACFEAGAPPTGDTRPDPVVARIYRLVGDDEAAGGNAGPAKIAYREALRRNPGDAAARTRLARLCRAEAEARSPAVASDRFEGGLALMQRGDRAGAIAAFEAARALEPDPAAALLEGICEFELGHDRRAQPLLEEARTTAGIAGTALFFLGLVSLRDGESARASSLFASATSTDDRIAAHTATLGRLARRDGRVVLSAFTEAGFDSNVELAPDGTTTAVGSGDGHVAGLAGLFLRPFGSTAPYARLTAQYRKQLRIDSYDLGDLGGGLGVRIARGGQFLAAEYGYDFVTLGRASYLSAHRLLATGRLVRGPFSILATAATRFEDFLMDATGGYSGLRHDLQAEADWQVAPALALGLGYHVGRDATSDAAFTYLEHGPLAMLRWAPRGSARLLAEARFTARNYDVVDPDLGARRAEQYLDGSAAGEADLSDRWTVRVVAMARRALSNLAEFQYTKVSVSAGLVYTVGLLP